MLLAERIRTLPPRWGLVEEKMRRWIEAIRKRPDPQKRREVEDENFAGANAGTVSLLDAPQLETPESDFGKIGLDRDLAGRLV